MKRFLHFSTEPEKMARTWFGEILYCQQNKIKGVFTGIDNLVKIFPLCVGNGIYVVISNLILPLLMCYVRCEFNSILVEFDVTDK